MAAAPLPDSPSARAASTSVHIDTRAYGQAGLAGLAFASVEGTAAPGGQHTQARHLAFLPPEALDLDLTNPAHRDFGDYELIEKLGQGGMGVVYRARQKSLDREVALKLLSAGPWASADFIARFQREAQSAARMQHPNIVPIYEIGAHEELNFFSMMLVGGESLAARLQRDGPPASRIAATLLRTIAEAVDYAHRLGVLHLDLKPGNVLLDERGEAQVADFGLARRIDDTLGTDNDEVSGTPSYMAPEQATLKTHKLSPATDVYGLGAILYELLTARPPFLGVTPQETLKRVVAAQPERPRALRADIPPDLDAICLKCLEKDPRERYPSARALADELGRYLDGRAVSVRPLNAPQRALRWARREPRLAFAAGAFVLALVAGLVATAIQWRRADANASESRDNLWRARAAAAQAALADGDGFSGLRPLVQNLVEMEAAGRGVETAVERQRIGTILANAPRLLDFIRLPPGEAVTSLAIAPGGRRFAIASNAADGTQHVRQFHTVDLSEEWSTPPVAEESSRLWDHGPMRYSPDGARLVIRLQVMNPGIAKPSGGGSIALDARSGRWLRPPAADGEFVDLVFSDDAAHALVRYSAEPSSPPDEGRWFATADWRPLGPRLPLRGYDQWLPSPDGRWLLGTGPCCRVTLFEPASLTPRWHVDLPVDDPIRAWRFSASGELVALGTRSGAALLVGTANGRQAPLPTSKAAPIAWLEFSEDAATLAILDEEGGLAAFDVATRKLRATQLRTDAPAGAWNVRLAGDAMVRTVGTRLERWQLAPSAPFGNAILSGAARISSPRVIDEFAFDLDPADGTLIVGGSDGKIGLWRVPPSVLLHARAAPLPTTTLQFDGRRIVTVDGRSVRVLDAATQAPLSAQLRHPDPVQFAELAVDGGSLVTVAGRTLRVFDPDSGSLRGPPVVLPGTPLRADLARAAPVLVLSTGAHSGERFEERLHIVDLDTSRLRANSPVVAGPLAEVRMDPMGRYAMAAHWLGTGDAGVTLIDLTGAGRNCTTVPTAPGTTADGYRVIAPDGRSAWIGVNLGQRNTRLLRWDVETCRVLANAEAPTIGTHPTLAEHGDGIVAHRLVDGALAVFDAQAARRETAGLTLAGSIAEIAVSRAGDRAALATRNSVLIVDLVSGERLSALLAAPIAGNDVIAQLAFSPDSTRLLGRTLKGRWLLWSLPVATQDAATLATLASLLDPSGSTPALEASAVDALRQLVRDSSPPPPDPAPAPPRPMIELAAAADAGLDPRFVPLDLAPAINAPLNGAWPISRWADGELVNLAPGVQRLNGIDWRLDGGVLLSSGNDSASDLHPPHRESSPIRVPGVAARRLHALVSAHVQLPPDADPHPMARVVLLDAAGVETALPIYSRRDVAPTWQSHLAQPSARIAWVAPYVALIRSGWSKTGGFNSQFIVHAVSLDVPPSTGPVTGIRLEIGDAPVEAPLFHALTLERSP